MALVPGTKLGPYEIAAALGAGGMGEVYRARDTRLERTVAIKILPAQFSSDPVRKQRFEREAKTISNLNHPHICVLHDIGHQDGIDYLVMECVEGETLAKRLEKGPLPLEQVLKLGAQIADALDKAHRSGVVHRDLKPGNIMLTPTGAKLLDFGLAKPAAPLTSLATLTATKADSPVTEQGTVVGTFQYMSPEQIEGQELDGRSDVFSLGAVLYEMVTGQKAFQGKSQLSVASAILEKEPQPIREIKPMTPSALGHAVRRCLAKDPDQRWQTSRDLARELDWIGEEKQSIKGPRSVPRHREAVAWALALVSIALLLWFGYARLSSTTSPERQHLRLSLLPPPSTSFVPYNFAISPDGQRLAFVAAAQDGGTSLWIRSFAADAAQQITGTEGASFPFWSSDNRRVGFFAQAKLKSVDPTGSAVSIICDAPLAYAGTWNQDGTIVFATLSLGRPAAVEDASAVAESHLKHELGRGSGSFAELMKVSASGGEPQPATKINAYWPSFLPDGRHFLFSSNKGIYVGSLGSMDIKLISPKIFGNTQFASGRFFYVQGRSLMAQPFNLERLQTIGQAEPIAQQELDQAPAYSPAGFSVSSTGVVVFQSASENVSRLRWFDRTGKELDEVPNPGYRDPALSRSGALLAVSADESGNGKRYIHIYDFARGTSTRVSDVGRGAVPVLSPDGRLVAYLGQDDQGSSLIYAAATDGSGKPERLVEGSGLLPNDWSPDGRYFIYMNFQNGPLPELGFYEFQKHAHSAYVGGAEAQFSPDGKWVAFTGPGSQGYADSDVFVARFPGPGRRVQVSNHGGAQARWRADGKELFYISLDKKLMAVSIDTTSELVAGVPRPLFQTRIIAPRRVLFQYAVAADGKRFLINSLPSVGATPLTVMIN